MTSDDDTPPRGSGPRKRATPSATGRQTPISAEQRAALRAERQALLRSRQGNDAAPRPDAPSPTAADPSTAFAPGPIDGLATAREERLFSRVTRLSFAALVVLPVLLAAAYLFLLADDRYAVEVKFAVRSPTAITTPDLAGLVTGGVATLTQSDSYMVVEYLQSRQFLDELASRVDLAEIYTEPTDDPLMHLPRDASKEAQVDYLAKMVHPTFDATAQIITVEAQAFTAQDAELMAQTVLETAGAMVNRLSEQARSDTVRLAELELRRAEESLRTQRAAIAAFRESEQKIDPAQTVATQEAVIGRLLGDLAAARATLQDMRTFLAADAPSIRVQESRIAAIENQITAERGRLGRGDAPAPGQPAAGADASLNSAVSTYEALSVDLDFRQKAYVSALSSLEAARIEADRQQRYLAAVVLPALPESPLYPRVALTLTVLGIVAFLIWGILIMFVNIIRDHLR